MSRRHVRRTAFTPLHRATTRDILSPQIMRTPKRRKRRAPAAGSFVPCISISEFELNHTRTTSVLVNVLEGRVVGAAAGEHVGEEVEDLFLVEGVEQAGGHQ